MQHETETDRLEHLLAAVAKGDRRAFRELYDLIAPRLYGVILAVLDKDREAAADVLSEVFETVWTTSGHMRSAGGDGVTWLLTLTRNATIQKARKRRFGSGPYQTGDGGQPDITERLYGTDGRGDLQDDSPHAQHLQACLSALPQVQQWQLQQAYMYGVTYSEFSEQSGASPQSIRSDLRAAILHLRERLSQ